MDNGVMNLIHGRALLPSAISNVKHLSFSECRNITSSSVSILRQLKKLRFLNLLGSVKIEDEGIIKLCADSDTLESINLSGTALTSRGVDEIVRTCSL